MLRRKPVITLLGLFAPALHAQEITPDLQEQIMQLTELVQNLQQQVNQLQSDQTSVATVDVIETLAFTGNSQGSSSVNLSADRSFVDLSPNEESSIETFTDSHVLSNPWWRNVEISGFAASGFYDTGGAGTRDHGSFEVKESSLFVEKGDRDRCLAAGMDDYLSKPFKEEELAVVLRRCLHVQKIPIASKTSHSPTQSSEPVDVLDRSVLSSIRNLSSDKMPDPLTVYTEIFLRNTPDLISGIKAAVESGDPESVVMPAHSLISYSGHLGAKTLEARCREIHEMGRAQQMTGANDVWIELNEQYTKAVAALKQECGITEQPGFN